MQFHLDIQKNVVKMNILTVYVKSFKVLFGLAWSVCAIASSIQFKYCATSVKMTYSFELHICLSSIATVSDTRPRMRYTPFSSNVIEPPLLMQKMKIL